MTAQRVLSEIDGVARLARQGAAWRSEQSNDDRFLLLAASMLDVAVPEHDVVLLAPEVRALVEDRLSQAGLEMWAPLVIRAGGCY